jgi:hypothetical protein
VKFNLAQMARRTGLRRKVVVFRPIITTTAQATDLAAISHRILAPWYGAAQRITEAYDRELSRIVTHDDLNALISLISEISDDVERLVLELTPSLRDWAFRIERWHRDKWRSTVLAGANVDVGYLIGPSDAQEPISAFLARNVALIRDISAQARGRISDAVFRGLQARTPAREVGKTIVEATGMARVRANRVAADQAVKLAAALDAQRQREAGLTVWRWRHSAKLHPRKFHLARDGNLYADDGADRGRLANGDDVLEPPEDEPGELPFCGCVRQGVLVIEGAVL